MPGVKMQAHILWPVRADHSGMAERQCVSHGVQHKTAVPMQYECAGTHTHTLQPVKMANGRQSNDIHAYTQSECVYVHVCRGTHYGL